MDSNGSEFAPAMEAGFAYTNSTEGNRTEMRHLKAAYFGLIFVFFDTSKI
jgi:hypothetical protein